MARVGFYDAVLKKNTDGSTSVVQGAAISVYLTGTTTLATLYENDGTTSQINPMASDANGNYSFRVDTGTYDFRIVYTGYDETFNNIVAGGSVGDVVGAASSTDNALARFDSTTGKVIQNGVVIASDTGSLSGVENITLSGTVDGRDVSVDGTKLDLFDGTDVASGKMLVADGAGFVSVSISGDATIASDGTMTVAAGAANAVIATAKVNEVGGITKGQLVYISGATAGLPQVSIADNADFSKADVLAVATETKANNLDIVITTLGLIENIDTSAFAEGNILYLGTSGALTATHPTGINAVQRVGHAVKINASTGSVLIELDGLTVINDHDGIMRHQLVNQNTGTNASSAYTIVNDAGHRSSVSMVGSNYTAVAGIAESQVIYNEGYNKTVFAVDGNYGYEWRTDITDSHNLSGTVKMTLSADGKLDFVDATYKEESAPSTPDSGKVRTYAKADGLMYSKDDAGVETRMSNNPESLVIAASDESTALTTGTAKVTFRMPYGFTLTAVRASVTTAPTGSAITVDINESGSTILSTKLTIDATEKTSTTAATPAVISDATLADDAEMTVDIDVIGSSVAGTGLKVYLIGSQV